eukprot:819108-Rhodomonas_salina.1
MPETLTHSTGGWQFKTVGDSQQSFFAETASFRPLLQCCAPRRPRHASPQQVLAEIKCESRQAPYILYQELGVLHLIARRLPCSEGAARRARMCAMSGPEVAYGATSAEHPKLRLPGRGRTDIAYAGASPVLAYGIADTADGTERGYGVRSGTEQAYGMRTAVLSSRMGCGE